MKKHIGISLFFMGCFLSLSATNYFVATNGDDSNAGTLDKPFATLQKAQSKVVPGSAIPSATSHASSGVHSRSS